MQFRSINHLLKNNECVLLTCTKHTLFQNLQTMNIASMKSHSLILSTSIVNTGKCEVLVQETNEN